MLGLIPADAEEYGKLMELYQAFDEVKKLDYPMTPHITLAYFSRLGFDAEAAGKLKQLVNKWNEKELKGEMEVFLNCRSLYYQKFSSMNDYVNVLPIYDK